MKKILPALALLGGAVAYATYKMKKEEKKKLIDLDQDLLTDPEIVEEPVSEQSNSLENSVPESEVEYDEEYPYVPKSTMEKVKQDNANEVTSLIEAGDDLLKERPVRHFIKFKTEEDLQSFKNTVINKGYVITKGEEDLQLYVLHITSIQEDKLFHHVYYLLNETYKNHGEYEGWNTKPAFA